MSLAVCSAQAFSSQTLSYLFIYLFIYLCYCSVTVVPIFAPLLSPAPSNPRSQRQSPPVFLVHGSFAHVLWLDHFNSLPHYSPPHYPRVTAHLFFISMSLVLGSFLLICFVDLVPFLREIIWYLSFTAWIISFSIILSSSIHAVAKVGFPSSFLLCSIPLCKCTTVFWSTHLPMDT